MVHFLFHVTVTLLLDGAFRRSYEERSRAHGDFLWGRRVGVVHKELTMYLSPKSQSPLFPINVDGGSGRSIIFVHIIYIYLEPVFPLSWGLNPPKEGHFHSKQVSFGFQQYINTIYKYLTPICVCCCYISIAQPESFCKDMLQHDPVTGNTRNVQRTGPWSRCSSAKLVTFLRFFFFASREGVKIHPPHPKFSQQQFVPEKLPLNPKKGRKGSSSSPTIFQGRTVKLQGGGKIFLKKKVGGASRHPLKQLMGLTQ